MRAPIRFSTAPHDTKWYGTALQPLGIVEVARATNSLLVPLAVAARPVATLRVPQRLFLPFPFSSVKAYWDEPIAGDEATVNRCGTALERLEARSCRPHGEET